jgi:DNA-binding response OmpR family regulator
MNPAKILIVHDEESIRFILTRTLCQEGYLLETAVHGGDALQKTGVCGTLKAIIRSVVSQVQGEY